MKVRIGIGAGTSVMSGDEASALAQQTQSALGFDSLWWSDVHTVPGDDPLAAMAYAAGRRRAGRVGTTMVLPGRNPVRLAKLLATSTGCRGARLLVTFVPRIAGAPPSLRCHGGRRPGPGAPDRRGPPPAAEAVDRGGRRDHVR